MPRTVVFEGGFRVAAPADSVFALFSPLGERLWVPGWNPELLHPPGAEWEAGLIFRTREEGQEAIWLITHLDRTQRLVAYHRAEPGRFVATVEVTCAADGNGLTNVRTRYRFVGLTAAGNTEIEAMTPDEYAAKMQRWSGWLSAHFERR
jgi:hypothetical protein